MLRIWQRKVPMRCQIPHLSCNDFYIVWHDSLTVLPSYGNTFLKGIIVFYDNFERVCAERGIKPSRACSLAGLKTQRATNWKSSGALPKQEELSRLAEVLECDVADFFREKTKARFRNSQEALEYAAAVEEAEAGGLTDDERDLLSFYRSLDRRGRAEFTICVMDFAEAHGVEY